MFAALATSLSATSKKNFLARIALIEGALAIDPDYVVALEQKATMYASLVLDGYSSNRHADLAYAVEAIDRALQLAPNSIEALRRKAFVLRAQDNWDGAAALVRKVIELEPLDGYRYRELGKIQMIQGQHKEALENFMTTKRLVMETSPFMDQDLATGLLANDRFPEAIALAQLAIAEWSPEVGRNIEFPWLTLIAAESENGQDEEARADLHKFLGAPRTWRTLAQVRRNPSFAANPKLLEGLRRAGMPAE
jgi:tetratricopeptide (TPR) repeat protein